MKKAESMKITVIAVGKVKEKSFREMIGEYSKRLGRYCKLEIIEVDDEKTLPGMSDTEEELIKRQEGERILSHVKDDSYVTALAIEGKELTSVMLSQHIEKLGVSGKSHLTFIIGGSLGLSQEVIKRSDFQLSFGRMTFPHQLMRVILLEQIYRSYRIMNNEPYHK